ncbi:MAG: hypothetical protein ABSF43_01575 [Rectinemataceae bacterium]|jgi:hypothetical protein
MNPNDVVRSDSYLLEGWTAVRSTVCESTAIPLEVPNPQYFNATKIFDIVPKRRAINDLGVKRFKLYQPLPVLLERTEGEYKAEIPQLEIYAFGPTEMEVLSEVKEEVVELCKTVFPLREKQMSSNVKTWKMHLQRYITKNA